MSEVFRILERFKITGRGTVYTIKKDEQTNIRIGDILFDLQGNRFKVRGIEMFRRLTEHFDFDKMPLGIMFELMDGVEAYGNILLRSLEDINFIFCNHPLYPRKDDDDYLEEYQSAGLKYPCALFSYEDMERGKLLLYGEEISGLTIYRGWMMKPEMYRDFYDRLEKRDIILINSPEEYERYHMLPGWYEEFKEYTAESIWENQGNLDNALAITKGLEGSYIVKDYVKSRKHEWYDACFIKNIADIENTSKIIGNFINRQGTDLVGGVVLRKFENLKHIGFHERSGMPLSEEYRVFVYAGKILILDDYWKEDKSTKLSDDERKWIGAIVDKIKSNFVTMDLARREDGALIIMELGDGQVSGLQQIKAEDFYKGFEIVGKNTIPAEEFLPDDVVILTGDPLPGKTVEEMLQDIEDIKSIQELVDGYVHVHNKFWFIEDDIYDFEKGTSEYYEACVVVDAWGELMDSLDSKVMEAAQKEELLIAKQQNAGTVKQLKAFMEKYGYKEVCGWWIKVVKA